MNQVAQFPPQASQTIWDDLINRYGEIAVLRQNGIPDRRVVCVLAQYSAVERMGAVSNPSDVKALISIFSPDDGSQVTPQPSERDMLVRLDDSGNDAEQLKIVAPVASIGPRMLSAPLYWRMQCRR